MRLDSEIQLKIRPIEGFLERGELSVIRAP